jgi:UDP:flavonoid glycosyltransferase YjiC (YdhE family)
LGIDISCSQHARHADKWHDTWVARFLFIVLPLPSHITPAVAIGQALAAGGHDVVWCGPESDLRPLVGPDVTVYPTGKRSYRPLRGPGLGSRMAAVQELWTTYIMPCNRFIKAAAERAVAECGPDVVITDQYALTGALAASRHGVAWASLHVGMLELTPPRRELPGLEEWVSSQLAQVWAMDGLPADGGIDLRFSPYLVIALTSAPLIGDAPVPEQCVLVGPPIGRRLSEPGFPWDFLDPGRRHVLVTVGTIVEHLAGDFYARMAAALGPMADRLQAVFVAPEGVVADPPPNVLVARRVPMLDLMPRLDAVVCHAGTGTVNEALIHGVPLIVAPIQSDQLTTAEQVARTGSGIEVSFAEATPAELAAAVTAVLDEPGYHVHARRVGDSLVAAGGASAAAQRLAALAAEHAPRERGRRRDGPARGAARRR